MNEELRLGYRELRERLEGDIGRQVRQLALQSSAIARTAQSEYRGETARPTGMAEVIAMVAVQDFLDLCFDQQPLSRS